MPFTAPLLAWSFASHSLSGLGFIFMSLHHPYEFACPSVNSCCLLLSTLVFPLPGPPPRHQSTYASLSREMQSLLILPLLMSGASGLTSADFYPYGLPAGDAALEAYDDVASPEFQVRATR